MQNVLFSTNHLTPADCAAWLQQLLVPNKQPGVRGYAEKRCVQFQIVTENSNELVPHFTIVAVIEDGE